MVAPARCGSETHAITFMQAFCKDVQHGHAKVIRCLEDNLEQPTFNATCKAEIQKHAANSATDYRWTAAPQSSCVAPVLPMVICFFRLSLSMCVVTLQFF